MESELGICAASIYRILTENLGYIKVCAKFVPHTLKSHEKHLRIQHSRDIIKQAKKNRNFYLPDTAPCDLYLFRKLHLAMKGKRYAIQKASTAILNAVPKDDLKKLKCLQKKTNFFFYKFLELLNSKNQNFKNTNYDPNPKQIKFSFSNLGVF